MPRRKCVFNLDLANILRKIASQEKYDFKNPKQKTNETSPGAMSVDYNDSG